MNCLRYGDFDTFTHHNAKLHGGLAHPEQGGTKVASSVVSVASVASLVAFCDKYTEGAPGREGTGSVVTGAHTDRDRSDWKNEWLTCIGASTEYASGLYHIIY
jgi:hypothetical protein